MDDHAADGGEPVARRDDVTVRRLADEAEVDDAIALLDRAESVVEVPLVDEAERARLHALAEGRRRGGPHWHALMARRDDGAVGYLGAVLPSAVGGVAVADLAVARDRPPCGPVVAALLAGVEAVGFEHHAERAQVWIRHADVQDVSTALDAGYSVERRLAVLSRPLDDIPSPDVVDGITIRAFTDADADQVVEVLAAAYADTPDGDWDRAEFDRRRDYDWFVPDDLLVADDGGRIVGVHWTKRRSDRAGEVYNLAVAPQAQGRGLGASLLRAGLGHLRDTGLEEALLWVDLSNERGVRLYASHGFHTAWEDVALRRALRGPIAA